MKIAFLSTKELEGFFVYDELTVPVFEQAGIQVDTVPWRDEVDWNQYDAVIVRSTWDYQQAPDAFMACLQRIASSSALLINPFDLMQWNIKKTYLKDLADKSVSVVPTLWYTGLEAESVMHALSHFDTHTLIVKPVLSANADDTFKITRDAYQEDVADVKHLFVDREIMIQPFLDAIVDEGEYSLFYFGGRYSHAIVKRPAKGDFRVQEEHGGQLATYTPEASVLGIAQQALDAMPADSLYARVDVVRAKNGWAIMELELIEPSLYFNLDEDAPKRFVDAFIRYMQSH